MKEENESNASAGGIPAAQMDGGNANATTIADRHQTYVEMETTPNNNQEALPPTTVPADLDELAQFALPPGQECVVATQKLLTQIPVRKPSKQEFVRTHPDMELWRQWPLLELKDESETYLVTSEVFRQLEGETTLVAARLVPTVNAAGVFSFWPIRLPDAAGQLNSWHESAANAATLAQSQWVRMTANRGLGGYDVTAGKFQQEPRWPELAQAELIKIAFRGRMITTIDHPVIRRLQGLTA